MSKTLRTLLILAAAAGLVALAPAQQAKKRASPHESVTATIGGKMISIEYGRPYKKGRDVFGGLEPYGKVWRTGADEATKLTTEADLMIGGIHVPAGTYSLFTIPEKDKWTLVLNKTSDQWGAFKYEEDKDLGRTPMKVEKLSSPVEQHTIEIISGGGNNATLKISWDTTSATAPIMIH